MISVTVKTFPTVNGLVTALHRLKLRPGLPGPARFPSRSRVLRPLSKHAGSCSRRCCVAAGTGLWWSDPDCSCVSFRKGRRGRLERAVQVETETPSITSAALLTCGGSSFSSWLQRPLHALRRHRPLQLRHPNLLFSGLKGHAGFRSW